MKKYASLSFTINKLILICVIVSGIFYSKAKAQTPQFEWVGSSISTSRAITYDVEIDQQGNIFYAGSFVGITDFDPGLGVTTIMSSFGGLAGAFIVKLDSNKNFIWVKTFVNSSYNQHIKMQLDAQGNILLVGNSYGSTTDFNPDTNIFEYHDYDGYLLKLDNNGTFIWVKGFENQLGNPQIANFMDMEIDAWGNVNLTGRFQGTVDFDFGLGVTLDTASTFKNFVLKVDSNGQFLWVKNLGQHSPNSVIDIAIDNAGNIYRTAKFDGSIDIDPDSTIYLLNGTGYYLLKLDSGGHFMWVKQFTNITPFEMITGANGNLYYTGSFTNTADFDHDTSTYNITAIGNTDIFVSKLTENGNFIWAKTFGGSQNERGANITLDQIENVYLAGYFEDIVNFSTTANSSLFQSHGNTDLFFAKLDSSGNMLWTKAIGGISTESVSDIDCNNNDIYIGGSFTETVDFDFGPNINSIQSYASPVGGELFVLKINQSVAVFSSSNSITICEGDTLLLNSGYPTGNIWNTGDTSQFIQVATSGQFYVSINNGTILSDTISVYVIPANIVPSLNITASDSLLCVGSQVQLGATNTNSNLPLNYSWSVNGTITNTTNAVFSTIISDSSNIYCYIQNSNVCNTTNNSGSGNINSNVVTINTFPSTQVTFNAPQSNNWICANDPPFQLTGGIPLGGVYSGSGVINNEFTPSALLPNINLIYYSYEDSNLCVTQAIDTFYVDVCTALSDAYTLNQIKIFPNPVKDIITLNLPNNFLLNTYHISISDVTGKNLYTTNQFQNNSQLNIAGFSSGMYYIVLENETNRFIGKFIKE